jgi:hypothetical protein
MARRRDIRFANCPVIAILHHSNARGTLWFRKN